MTTRTLYHLICAFTTLTLSACGGGGGAPPSGGPANQSTSAVSGVASKGPVRQGTVKVFAIRNGVEDRSGPIGQGQTDDSGRYTIGFGTYTGPVVVEISGGTYVDEVSGVTVPLSVPLHTVVSGTLADTSTAAVTPYTELAYKKALGSASLTPTVIDEANAKIASLFGLGDIVGTLPATGASASAAEKKYAAALGAFSQLTNDKRVGAERLEDSLARVMTQLGDEQQNGGLSLASYTDLNNAITRFTGSGKNSTGGTVSPVAMPTSGVLKIATSGIPSTIGAIDLVINLPAGVRISAAPVTGETTAGVVTVSGVAATGTANLSLGRLLPGTPAQLRVQVLNAAGFGLGEFVTIRFDMSTGSTFPIGTSAFPIVTFSAVNGTGAVIGGISAATSFVGG